MSEPRVIKLRHVEIRIHEETRYVETILPNGSRVSINETATAHAITKAMELGYVLGYTSADVQPTDDRVADLVWRYLIDHEVAHAIIAEDLQPDGLPLGIRHESGDHQPYYLRVWEEAIVLAFQRFVMTEERTGALTAGNLEFESRLRRWRDRLREVVPL